jgi:dTDP-4-amino-4,6-dideoxygalactose transaminase
MPVLLAGGGQRQAVMNQLRERGIQTSIHYPAIHQFSFYRDRCAVSLPLTEAVASRQLTLPLYPAMEVGQVNQVVEVLEEVACEECVYN